MSRTYTVEGDVTAADTRTALTTQGSNSTPSSVVPAGMSKIDKLVVAGTSEGLADGAQSLIVRLGGNAVLGGEQVIAISAFGRIGPQSGSDSAPQLMTAWVLEDADIEVRPSDTISISAEGPGTDTGTVHVGVTAIYA
jgi:hypothetical protein